MTSKPHPSRFLKLAAICFVVVQVALPLYMLSQPRAQRFGWQMYSGIGAPGRIALFYNDGGERQAAIGDWLAKTRTEMHERERRAIVSGICERERQAGRQLRHVRMVLSPGEDETEVPCS